MPRFFLQLLICSSLKVFFFFFGRDLPFECSLLPLVSQSDSTLCNMIFWFGVTSPASTVLGTNYNNLWLLKTTNKKCLIEMFMSACVQASIGAQDGIIYFGLQKHRNREMLAKLTIKRDSCKGLEGVPEGSISKLFLLECLQSGSEEYSWILIIYFGSGILDLLE